MKPAFRWEAIDGGAEVAILAAQVSLKATDADVRADAKLWLQARGFRKATIAWVASSVDAQRNLKVVKVKVLKEGIQRDAFDVLHPPRSLEEEVVGVAWFAGEPDADDLGELNADLASRGYVAVATEAKAQRPGWKVRVRAVPEDLYNEVLEAEGSVRRAVYYIAEVTLRFTEAREVGYADMFGGVRGTTHTKRWGSLVLSTCDLEQVVARVPIADRRFDGNFHQDANGNPVDISGLGADVADITVRWITVNLTDKVSS